MRKLYYIVFMLLLLAACIRTEDNNMSFNPDDVTFYAINADMAETKTVLQADGTIQWLPKDEINVFYSGTESARFVSNNTENAAQVAFKGALKDFTYREGASFWAVYPYRESHTFSGESLTVSLPADQVAVAGSFADDLFVSIARTTNFNLHFYNVCGGIEFSVTEPGVKTVTFKGNGDEPLAGSADISFDQDGKPVILNVTEAATSITLTTPDGSAFQTGVKYYIALWPATLENGYRITLTKEDGTSTIKNYSKSVTVKRAVWGVLEDLDKGLSYEHRVPDNEIWYMTTDGQIVSPNNMDGLVSNDYSNGKGRMLFDHQVVEIPYGAFYAIANLETISLPESVAKIYWSAFDSCEGLRSIDMPGVTFIDRDAFSGSGLTGSLALPEGLVELRDMVFARCPNLTEVIIPTSLKLIGLYEFDGTPLKKLVLKPVEPPVPWNRTIHPEDDPVSYEDLCMNSADCMIEDFWHSGGLIYVPESGIDAYQSADLWKYVCQFMTVEGHLPSDFFYTSTDFSRDGEVVVLQNAAVGNGVNLFFLGDGYVDKDLEPGGKYEERIKFELENFFSYEPYKSLRNRFNIYRINVVSNNDVYRSPYAVRALTKDVDWNNMDCYDQVAMEYARKAPVPEDSPLFIVVLRNKNNTCEADFCTMYLDNPVYMAIAFCSDRRNTGDDATVPHEMGGHGIGRLADEYLGVNCTFPEGERESLDQVFTETGFGPNVDWRNSPNAVRWSAFLSDSRYTEEGLGVFEGAYLNEYGIYRCSENSVMNGFGSAYTHPSWITSYWFNAPSREAIYKQVMKLSEGPGWQYDYETFVEADAAGREHAATKYREWRQAYEQWLNDNSNAASVSQSSVERHNLQPAHLPPRIRR